MLEPVDEFFDTGDFAQSATYVDASSVSKTILVIFQARGTSLKIGDETFQTLEDTALCKSADVAGVTKQCKLTVGSVQYRVSDDQPDGTGITRLVLSRE